MSGLSAPAESLEGARGGSGSPVPEEGGGGVGGGPPPLAPTPGTPLPVPGLSTPVLPAAPPVGGGAPVDLLRQGTVFVPPATAASPVASPQHLYSEGWSLVFPAGTSTAFFAYCQPYTMTDMLLDLTRWEGRARALQAGAFVHPATPPVTWPWCCHCMPLAWLLGASPFPPPPTHTRTSTTTRPSFMGGGNQSSSPMAPARCT
jgi:hypothetical protein